MQRLQEFRIYYNQSIHPELLRMERKRKQLLSLLGLSLIALILGLLLENYIKILAITLTVSLLMGVYISYLLYRIRHFVNTFKPKIIQLILNFIEKELNYKGLQYDALGKISKANFQSAQLFMSDAPFYKGEDRISGQYGRLTFEFCELFVKGYSKTRHRLDDVFKGLFFHAQLNHPLKGQLLVVPYDKQTKMFRTLKHFFRHKGKKIDQRQFPGEFSKAFSIFATQNTVISTYLSKEMQTAFANFHKKTNRPIYASFINNTIYVGVSQENDLLEPYIFKSNVNFKLIHNFYENIELCLEILKEIEWNNY